MNWVEILLVGMTGFFGAMALFAPLDRFGRALAWVSVAFLVGLVVLVAVLT